VDAAKSQAEQIETDIRRALVRAPVDGVVLQVNVHPGEYVGTPPIQALIVLGAIDHFVQVRVDVDEHDIPRFKKGAPARASLRGTPEISYPLEFVRVEPYVVPKKSLTGDNTERVDTRVLQVIYALDVKDKPIYVGQQMDVFIDVGDGDSKAVAPTAPGS
jgi:multidrug resistance efflux pump